jgi:hypothetical protein
MNKYKIEIEQLINMNYIKYDRLVSMVSEAFVGSTADTVDIFIDMYSLIKPLYSNNNYSINDYSAVTSCLVNMCAHYRAFFKRYRVSTRFFIIFSKNCSEINKKFCYGYNAKNENMMNSNKLVTDMIEQNVELLDILCPYLPDIFFIQSSFETAVVMTELIIKHGNINTPSIIITKDSYNYQLVNTNVSEIVIFRPKKYNGQDISYIVNQQNLYQIYIMENCNQNEDVTCYFLSPELLSVLMSINKVSSRNIKSIYNIKKSILILQKSIKDNLILNGYNSDIRYLWECLYQYLPELNYSTFETRFKAIDIKFQYTIYMNSIECSYINLLNLYDPEAVKGINNKYFRTTNPLDLDRL